MYIFDEDGEETGEYRYEGMLAHKANESIGKHLGFLMKMSQAIKLSRS